MVRTFELSGDQTSKGDFGHHPRGQPITAPVQNGKNRSKPGVDGIVRITSIKTVAGTRNIRNITLLPINNDSTSLTIQSDVRPSSNHKNQTASHLLNQSFNGERYVLSHTISINLARTNQDTGMRLRPESIRDYNPTLARPTAKGVQTVHGKTQASPLKDHQQGRPSHTGGDPLSRLA